jgi:acetylornithine/succinyldiaminopimelate/putrescine aminotransferase
MFDRSLSPDTSAVELEDRYHLHVYAKLPLVVDHAEGCWVFDHEGRRYLDLYGGHAVTATGHCHPTVVEALRRQVGELIFYSNSVYNSVRAKAAQKLLSFCPGYARVFFVNSGAEANENAIKLARALTGRTEIISLEHSFHGRTYGSLSATGIAKYRNYLNTPVPQHCIVPAEAAPSMVGSGTAGVLVEPIQSMGGVRVISANLLADLEKACRRHGALLIFDEVQTGIGRTGKTFLYSQRLGLHPDICTLAKGLGSGCPVGAVLLTESVAAGVSPGDLGTTFGGSPLASAAVLATLEVVEKERLPEHVEEVSSYLRHRLQDLSMVEEVRGQGLLIGLTFGDRPAGEAQQYLLSRSILTGSSYDPRVLRLMPPLTLQPEHIDRFVEALAEWQEGC